MSVNWGYYDKFDRVMDSYLPSTGEGKTMGSQLVTAINKLIYKWYNDGDVFDNTGALTGWANDLSSYANWIYKYIPRSRSILDGVYECYDDDDYEHLLKVLADNFLDDEDIENLDKKRAVGSIYDCNGPFEFYEKYDEGEDDYYDENYYDEDYDEEEED